MKVSESLLALDLPVKQPCRLDLIMENFSSVPFLSCLSLVVTGIAAHSENAATFGKGISLGSLGLDKICKSENAKRTPRCNMACMKPRRQITSLKLLIFLDFRRKPFVFGHDLNPAVTNSLMCWI